MHIATMKKTILLFLLFLTTNSVRSQSTDSLIGTIQSSADRLLTTGGKLLLGGYGEVHYNQPLNSGIRNNGVLDVHRMVVLLGYNFTSKTQFISEIEFEHVSEVYIEQAFLQYKLNSFLNFRAGLMLIPMGIVNEYHEPTAFNGVERPVIDTRISPSTWREIGVGVAGNLLGASLKYQFYVVNGFNSYDTEGRLRGRDGLRNGRQKGAESYISSPNITGKIEYYGIRGLNTGISGYFGKTQSKLYNGIDRDDNTALARADSSVTGIAMIGIDARYQSGGWQMRGQFYYTALSNTDQYNVFTARNGVTNDLGSAIAGYYLEAGYNVLKFNPNTNSELILFTRYENFNMHNSTANGLPENRNYDNDVITAGFSLKLAKGAVVKADLQLIKTAAAPEFAKSFNAGVGVMF